MMTQPAGAGGATHRSTAAAGGTLNDITRGVIADPDGAATPAATGAAPFSQAMQALAAGAAGSDATAPGTASSETEVADVAQAPASAPERIPAGSSQDSLTLPAAWCQAPAFAAPDAAMPAAAAAETAAAGTDTPAANAGAGAHAGVTESTTGARTASTRQASARGALRNTPRAGSKSAAGALQLPKDLLQALFAGKSTPTAQVGTAPPRGAGESDDDRHDTAKQGNSATDARDSVTSASMAVPATVPIQPQTADAGAGLLAAVLQWLQPSRHDSNAPDAASTEPDAMATASATATASASSTRAEGSAAAPSAGLSPPAHGAATRSEWMTPQSDAAATIGVADLPGKATGMRDAESQGAATVVTQLPRSAADAAAGALGMAAALRAANAGNPAQVERSVAVPVHDRHWPAAVAAQVLILSNDKLQAATLRLSPEHLGPVEVRIDVQDANVNVNFTAAHADTRAALEQALPELRLVLAGAGLTLGQATVQQQARHESQNPQALPRSSADVDAPIDAPTIVARALGIIDEYA